MTRIRAPLSADEQYYTGFRHGTQSMFYPRYRVYPDYCKGYRDGLAQRSSERGKFNPIGQTNGFAWNMSSGGGLS